MGLHTQLRLGGIRNFITNDRGPVGDFNLCKEREGDTPHLFCVYKYKGMVQGIEAKGKDIMGLKETKLLGVERLLL